MSSPNLRLYHYDLDSLAKSLKLVSIDVIKTTNMDIESHWFRSSGPADFYYWKAKDKIIKHQISLYNQVVEWNEYDGVKTGFVNDDVQEVLSEVICFDQLVNQEVVAQAVEFLKKIEQPDKEIVNQLISNYQFYNKWQGLALFRGLRSLFKKLSKG